MSLSKKLGLDDIDASKIAGKRVLMRVDFNVPLHKETLQVTDATRLKAAVPTIQKILAAGPKNLILMSHL